jgi:hypothetical protein
VLQRKDGEPVADWLLAQLTGEDRMTNNAPISPESTVSTPVLPNAFASPSHLIV